jgi:cobalt-zinc-cadmium efflux system protein
MVESYQRFWHPPIIQALPTLIVASLGFIVNIASLKLLSSSAKHSINAKAAYLEIFSDSLASIGVIISSLLIMFWHFYFVDAMISALIAVAILPRTWGLLKECLNILMEGTPSHMDLAALRAAMIAIEGVVDIHDIHVWTITSGLDAMSGHVMIDDRFPAVDILAALTKVVKNDFGIDHTTIQVEQVEKVHCEKTGKYCRS